MPARHILVRGVVQGVGFRPFVYRLAQNYQLQGWVLNDGNGVGIYVEGNELAIDSFLAAIESDRPAAAQLASVEIKPAAEIGIAGFTIRQSRSDPLPRTRISPDLPVCPACLAELFDPEDPRYHYPYINCTNCGPRFSVVESLPYDRSATTMSRWAMDELCQRQYHDPSDRRFHAQPLACAQCGPHYFLESRSLASLRGEAAIASAVDILRNGHILAIKGIGGYHLSCNAHNPAAVLALRERKFRRERPFALMAATPEQAASLACFSSEAQALLLSPARPIVLVPARVELPGVAPGSHEFGILLPYAPLHHLLFAAGAPSVLVMTSANHSSEPIAYADDDARERLTDIADALLIGERPIARRVDDSIARAGVFGPAILRRSRGYAPGAIATLPTRVPILAVGADLKNAITLAIEGQAFVSQYIGDLDHYACRCAFNETIRDFLSMYSPDPENLVIAHDRHPEYISTLDALDLPGRSHIAVQHHHAHVSSVLAEREAWHRPAVGISFDGTGYGDDGRIWGGEFFVGSVAGGWTRALHLRNALLVGGDAAARSPVRCAAGFLAELDSLPDLFAQPFNFPHNFHHSQQLAAKRIRTFYTSSIGRLFDTVAALLGFTRSITFEGQAAIWLEELARMAPQVEPFPFPVVDGTLDFRPLLLAILDARLAGMERSTIARRFHASVAGAAWTAAEQLCEAHSLDLIVLSGGVFQNELLLSEFAAFSRRSPLEVWTNRAVPTNDGGISFGQAASACFRIAP